jgi:hypothetical protein
LLVFGMYCLKANQPLKKSQLCVQPNHARTVNIF